MAFGTSEKRGDGSVASVVLDDYPREYLGDPLKGTLLNPTSGSLKRELVERVYIICIPKGPPFTLGVLGVEFRRLGFGKSA